MPIFERRPILQVVVRVDGDLMAALYAACREHGVQAADVSGQGTLDAIELAVGRSKPKASSGNLELLSLRGVVQSGGGGELRIEARALVARERDGNVELLGGRLVSARGTVDLLLDAYEPLPVAAGDAEPAKPEPPKPEPKPVAPSWQDAVAVSATATPGTDKPDETRAGPGDLIDHPTFGRCQVERIEGDYEFVSVRLRNQRLIRLSLDVVALIPAGREGEHRLFRVERA